MSTSAHPHPHSATSTSSQHSSAPINDEDDAISEVNGEYTPRMRANTNASDDNDITSPSQSPTCTHSFRSDISCPDVEQYLGMMTSFPILPVIGMFKNVMLPVEGEEEDDGGDDDAEDSGDDDQTTDIGNNDGVTNDNVISSLLSCDNEELDHNMTFDDGDSVRDDDDPRSYHMNVRRSRTDGDDDDDAIRRDSLPSTAGISSDGHDCDSSFPRLPGRIGRSLSFCGVCDKKKSTVINERDAALSNAIKAKEFEVARANAKRKRVKKKILEWLSAYANEVDINLRLAGDERAVLSQLNREYDEVSD